MELNIPVVLKAVLEDYALPLNGDHGVAHWARVLENGLRLSAQAATGQGTLEVEAEARAAGTYATELAVEVITEALRWAGGEAIRRGTRFESALRDINVASTHYCLNNTSLESHGQYLLGHADVAVEAYTRRALHIAGDYKSLWPGSCPCGI